MKRNNPSIHIGKTYSYLKILQLEIINKRKYFKCECICGKRKSINCQDVLQNQTKSCGCKRQELFKKAYDKNYTERFPDPVASFLFCQYKEHGREFLLSLEEFSKLIYGNCFYCDDSPSNLRTTRRKHFSKFVNGVDRVDNNIGYQLNNCVSCCSICNYMKRSLLEKKFYEHIKKLYHNLIKNGK